MTKLSQIDVKFSSNQNKSFGGILNIAEVTFHLSSNLQDFFRNLSTLNTQRCIASIHLRFTYQRARKHVKLQWQEGHNNVYNYTSNALACRSVHIFRIHRHLRLLGAHKLSCFKPTMRDTPRFPVVHPPVGLQSRQRRQRWRRQIGTATRRWEPCHGCGPNTGAGRRATRSDSGPRFCTGSGWPVQVKTNRKRLERKRHHFLSKCFRQTSVLFFCLSFDWNLIIEKNRCLLSCNWEIAEEQDKNKIRSTGTRS